MKLIIQPPDMYLKNIHTNVNIHKYCTQAAYQHTKKCVSTLTCIPIKCLDMNTNLSGEMLKNTSYSFVKF